MLFPKVLLFIFIWLFTIWNISSLSIKIIEVSPNKLLRNLWNLPQNSHSAIVHCVAEVDTVTSLVYSRFRSLLSTALSLSFPLVQSVFFSVSSHVIYFFRI